MTLGLFKKTRPAPSWPEDPVSVCGHCGRGNALPYPQLRVFIVPRMSSLGFDASIFQRDRQNVFVRFDVRLVLLHQLQQAFDHIGVFLRHVEPFADIVLDVV